MLSTAFLQFWHAELNKMFFDGELETAYIRIGPEREDETVAEFEERTVPFMITFFEGPATCLTDELFSIETLLHEMCHQYVREHELTEDDPHGPEFVRVAESHGMKRGGYMLSDDARSRIGERLSLYRAVASLGFITA